METEIKKSYNPFTMLGSWIGFILGSVGSIFLVYVIDNDPYFLGYLASFGLEGYNARLFCWVILALIPVFFFVYGWLVQFSFRKVSKGKFIFLLIIMLLIVIYPIVYIYKYERKEVQNFGLEYSLFVSDIHSQDKIKAMNALKFIIKTYSQNHNLEAFHNDIFYILSDTSILIDVRFRALELLVPNIEMMSLGEKDTLNRILSEVNDKINSQNQLLDLNKESNSLIKSDNERVMLKVVELKNLLR